jgi:DNA-binding FadR family transcriptional regulator
VTTEIENTAGRQPPHAVPGALGRPVASSSRVDDLTDRLVTAIAIGEYLPGSRLPPERDLAASLGAGRMTVRAALARLVDRGLLETQRGRGGGSFVTDQWPVSSTASVQRILTSRWESLRETCDAISRLHGTIARAAAENRTDDDLRVIADRLEAFREADSGLAKQRADASLHVAIVSAAGNGILRDIVHELESRISLTAPAHLWGEPAGMAAMEQRALLEHEALVGTIARGEADEAAAIAREHVKIDFELLETALTRSRD